MDPLTLATSVAVDLIGGDLFRNSLSEIIKMMGSKLSVAKDNYAIRTRNSLDRYIDTRQASLNKLNETQTRAILQVTDQSQLRQILTMSLELTIQAYEAKTEQELNMISGSINRIESFLDRYENDRKRRNRQRILAIIICVFLFILLFAFAIYSPLLNIKEIYAIPILKIPLSVLLWSALGSIASMLYRFNKASDVELQDPLRYLISRPLFGILMGTLIYLAVKVGFLTAVSGNQEISLGTNELVWLISFLVGFSDRFSDEILKSLIGRLGGDEKNALITTPSNSSPNSGFNLLDTLQGWGKQIGESAKKIASIPNKAILDLKSDDEKENISETKTIDKPASPKTLKENVDIAPKKKKRSSPKSG